MWFSVVGALGPEPKKTDPPRYDFQLLGALGPGFGDGFDGLGWLNLGLGDGLIVWVMVWGMVWVMVWGWFGDCFDGLVMVWVMVLMVLMVWVMEI